MLLSFETGVGGGRDDWVAFAWVIFWASSTSNHCDGGYEDNYIVVDTNVIILGF